MTLRLSSACSNQLSYAPTRRVAPETGGADEDRTRDLLLAKQALSQLSYGPAGRCWVATLPQKVFSPVLTLAKNIRSSKTEVCDTIKLPGFLQDST